MTPARYRELADHMESEGNSALRDMLTEDPKLFWDYFARFADPGRQWEQLSDAELADINQRFVAFMRERARLRTN
jgi:hypothetical protein